MKYVSLTTYQNEFSRSGEKLRLFFNPDNTVAIFEDTDVDVWNYVFEKGAALKEQGFAMNHETEGMIREYLASLVPAAEKAATVETIPNEVFKPLPALFSEKKFADLLKKVDDKPTVAKLTEIVKEILVAVQAQR